MMRDLTPNTTVTPAKAGAWLFFSNLAFGGEGREGSQTPDQVRGDGTGEGRARG
jgi:hypothetical protein